jgi:hypothetical protein
MKFVRRMVGYTHLYYKENLDIMEELNTRPIIEFAQNYRLKVKTMFFPLFKNPIPYSLLPTKRMKIFGKTLQMLA